jgi:hypothetical protein
MSLFLFIFLFIFIFSPIDYREENQVQKISLESELSSPHVKPSVREKCQTENRSVSDNQSDHIAFKTSSIPDARLSLLLPFSIRDLL